MCVRQTDLIDKCFENFLSFQVPNFPFLKCKASKIVSSWIECIILSSFLPVVVTYFVFIFARCIAQFLKTGPSIETSNAKI